MSCSDVVTSLRLDSNVEAETSADDAAAVKHEDEGGQSNCVYRLQILYGTNLQGSDFGVFSRAPRTSDPYLVVSYRGNEIARSTVTQQSTTPLFKSLQNATTTRCGFCVDVPNEIAFASTDRARAPELIVQVYDHDSIGSGNFLGETRLRALDLRSAVGRRVAKNLKPKQGNTTRQSEHKFVGGELHIAGHLISGQPHLMVHVIGACDFALKRSRALALSTTKTSVRGILPLTKGDFFAMSIFVICYWEGKEVGRTDVQRQTECPKWGGDPENVFRVNLNMGKERDDHRVSLRKYSPELRFEIYDAVLCRLKNKRVSLRRSCLAVRKNRNFDCLQSYTNTVN